MDLPVDTGRLVYRIAFASLRGFNASVAREMLSRVGDEETFFDMSERQLCSLLGHSSRIFDRSYRDSLLEDARREVDFVVSGDIRPLYFTDDDYPTRLAECDDAPVMLYSLGHSRLNDSPVIAIVGTRHATSYGVDRVNDIVATLASRLAVPPVVVSGLAFGIDIAAHRAALSCHVPTVAVLAHGLNTIYPAVHRRDAAAIARDGGMLLTEYRSIDATHKGNFLARNRIIAGLSDCVLVAESAEKGGAIVTARLGADYNREVAAIPGRSTDRYSAGCNRMIHNHTATLVTSADDILELMQWPVRDAEPVQQRLFPSLSPEEEAIVSLLTDRGDMRQTELAAALSIPTPRLMGLLIDMEFKSLIAPIPGGRYRLA